MNVLVSDCRESSAWPERQDGSLSPPHCALGTGEISDSESLSLSLCHCLSRSVSLSVSVCLSLFLSLSLVVSHSLFLSLSFSAPLFPCLSLSVSFSPLLPSLSFSVSVCLSVSVTLSHDAVWCALVDFLQSQYVAWC